MSYKFITSYDSPNFGYGDNYQKHGGNDPKEIIIHYWDDPKRKPSIEGVVNTLCNPNRQASAHDVVQDGVCYHLVRYGDPAWHAGDYYVNTHSIGIECSPYLTDGDFRTVAEVIANIWKTYGKLPLRGHKDVASTSCPGPWYPRLGELYKLAEKYYNGETNPKPSKPSKPSKKSVTEIAKEVINGKWGNGQDRMNRLKKAGYNPNEVQNKVNELLGSATSEPKMTARQFALEVWNEGKHGVGATRKLEAQRLGVNYNEAQRLIDILANGGKI